ncbi:mandelate racemase/muconate lactonizing enzyme family protein [Pedobacter sp. UBA4863]|uniref:mandelate racemase/muconate lactonizing enzyme family protein n=1 Tax=Pedobacter sp. UBA4863 TaxID=1947060 RepID=UPI0025E07349|nr:dipeptide epimerase [Pedobacter sp. UBA4863]
MIITNIEIFRFSIKMEPFAIATGTMTVAPNVLIKINTETGIYGWGECSPFPVITGETQDTCIVVAKDFAKLLKGKNALDIDGNLAILNSAIAGNSTIKSAFDMALYDIAAKAENMPLYQFLGAEKKQIETDITIGIDTPEKMTDKAAQYIANGATMLKVKLGKNPKQDVLRMQKIRSAVGENIKIKIDANQGYSFDEAVFVLNEMADLDLQFCEQPMRSWDDHLLPSLISKSSIKIMADESIYNHHDAIRLINTNATDYLNIKLAKSGGINEALKINKVAEEVGMKCMIGGMLETRLALAAKVHLAYAASTVMFFDLDTCLVGHLENPVIGGANYNGFFVDVLDTPGIGADVDPLYLKRCENWVV